MISGKTNCQLRRSFGVGTEGRLRLTLAGKGPRGAIGQPRPVGLGQYTTFPFGGLPADTVWPKFLVGVPLVKAKTSTEADTTKALEETLRRVQARLVTLSGLAFGLQTPVQPM